MSNTEQLQLIAGSTKGHMKDLGRCPKLSCRHELMARIIMRPFSAAACCFQGVMPVPIV